LLTALVAAALFAFLPSAAFGANPSANLDQCANGQAPSPSSDGCNGTADTDWVNGNLGASKAVYFEGDSIPYRLTFDNLSLSSHSVTIEWDTTKSGTHALDYITSYNESVLDANPCLGVTGCNPFSFDEFPIPADPQVTGAGVTPIAGNLTMFGGDITAVSAYSYPDGTGFAGDKSARITITFTATTANPVLAWGGHIASRQDWGLTASAVSIPGSPYHTRLIDLDGAGGNQDRSLSAEAVIFPGFIHIVKNTIGGDATFGYTASPSPLSNFNITTVNGTGENDFNNITNFQTYTVTENAPPSHWVFDNLLCTVASANGGTQTVNNMTATIDLKEGEQVTCTYANHHAVNAPTLTTNAGGPFTLGADGNDLTDSATLAGATSDASGTITFKLFSDANCTVQVGSDVTKTVNGNGVYVSPAIHVNSAGTYHWIANYGGDANNSATSNGCNGANENVVVNPRSPTVTTDAGPAVTLGANGTDLTDSATLAGGTTTISGTITFKLFSDANCTVQVGSDVTKTVNGNGVYVSPAVHVNSAGTYHWIANYGGDANNSATSNGCNGANENVVVNPRSPTVTTDAGPAITLGANGSDLTDSATLAGGTTTISGTITFKLFSDANCTVQVGSDVTKTVNGNGVYVSPAIHVNSAGTYHWIANYGGDANNNATSNTCNEAKENVVVNPLSPSVTTNAGPTVRLGANGTDLTDTATLSGATSNASGKITFQLFSDANCETQVGSDVSTTVDGNDDYVSPPIHVTAAGTYHWIANYSGDGNNSPTQNGCNGENENVLVISPAISISKKPDSQTIRNGDTASWTITVTNTGDSTLTDVHVDDAQAPGCARTAAQIALIAPHLSSTFAPGDSVSYDCSLAGVSASFTNTAVATGTDETDQDVTAQDSADVRVINPHVTILKTPDQQTIVSGQTASFTIQVINDGDSTLTNVVVTDALAPGCARTSADIPGLASMPAAPAAGSTITYTCTLANVTASFTNTAVATGKPEVGPNVSSQDTAAVTVLPPVTHPAISIVKDPNSQTVNNGGTATFTITVLNTGDVALTNVVVTDALSPNCNRTIGTLAPGQSVSYKCTRPNVTKSFTNVAVVTGQAGSTTLTAQDTAPVTARAPFVPKVVPKVVSHKKPKATG
jgi:uncharacterized repeat protein (TIGR01451 family)